jgi:hypothetical protein
MIAFKPAWAENTIPKLSVLNPSSEGIAKPLAPSADAKARYRLQRDERPNEATVWHASDERKVIRAGTVMDIQPSRQVSVQHAPRFTR